VLFSPSQIAVAVAAHAALLAASAGLLIRRRWCLSWFLAAYVLANFVGDLLVDLWPARFWVPSFWMAKQALCDTLKLGIAVELAWRAFRLFPGAASTARKIVLAILGVTAATMLAANSGPSYEHALSQLHPRVATGTVWLLAATLAVALWYRVPIHPFHMAVLTSLGAYSTVFGSLLGLAGLYGWHGGRWLYLTALDPLAFLLLLCWWAYVAWRPESEVGVAYMRVVQRVQLRTAT